MSPPDARGSFTLGTNAEYVAPMIGRVPFFLEGNARMPRTFGLDQIHASQVLGFSETDRPLVAVPPVAPDARDAAMAASACARTRPSRRSRSARSGWTSGWTTTAPSRCCRSTTSTTRGRSRASRRSSRSTRGPRSTSTGSARRRRSPGATGRRAHVVTECGVADLRGRSIADRARALIAIADPGHRDALEAEAREGGILPRRSRGAPSPPGKRAARPQARAG